MLTHDPYWIAMFVGLGQGFAILVLAFVALCVIRLLAAGYRRLLRWTDEQIAYKGPTPADLMADPEWLQHAGLGEPVTNSRSA